MSVPFRLITARDIDNFIQFPGTISINADNADRDEENIVLTIFKEDVILENYDRRFIVNDYAIYSSITTTDLFNNGMDWKYMVKNTLENNQLTGSRIVDAHDEENVNALPLSNDIINRQIAKAKLGTESNNTRFSHYRQCDRFFKYSFRIGDNLTLSGSQTGQVYGVYLDTDTGDAKPYWSSTVDGQQPEQLRFYYADLDLNGQYGLTFDGFPVTVVCPPHPDFIASTVIASTANNLVYKRDEDGNLMIRTLGFTSISHTYNEDDFVLFSESSDRQLLVYIIIDPQTGKHFNGEILVPLWSSKQIDQSWGPIRDIMNDLGDRVTVSADSVQYADRFTCTKTVVANTFQSIQQIGSAPRMHYPVSRIATVYIEDGTPMEIESVPFAYDVANNATFAGDAKKSIIGGRIMQLVSSYMFDGCSDKEMAYFPYLLNESKALTNKIVDYLGAALISSRESRNSIIDQIVIKYGRRYFDEMSVYLDQNDHIVGDMWNVIDHIPEFFLFFTATISTSISTRTKDKVDIVQFPEVPIVLRIHKASV